MYTIISKKNKFKMYRESNKDLILVENHVTKTAFNCI